MDIPKEVETKLRTSTAEKQPDHLYFISYSRTSFNLPVQIKNNEKPDHRKRNDPSKRKANIDFSQGRI